MTCAADCARPSPNPRVPLSGARRARTATLAMSRPGASMSMSARTTCWPKCRASGRQARRPMLTENQLRTVAARSGARDITKVEIDVILTHLLALLEEKGISGHLAFKGGTMLRKMVFGPRGRYSTDLDFTLCTDIDREELMLMMLDAVAQPFGGLNFRFDRD